MPLYYVETSVGCGIQVARNADQARRHAQREVGTLNDVTDCHLATDDEIAWVRAMGGNIPEELPPPTHRPLPDDTLRTHMM